MVVVQYTTSYWSCLLHTVSEQCDSSWHQRSRRIENLVMLVVDFPIFQDWWISFDNPMTESLRNREGTMASDRSENRRGKLPSGFTGVHLLAA